MRRREPARVLGPYKEGEQWRVIIVDERGRRKSRLASTRQAALRLGEREHKRRAGLTIGRLIDEWADHRIMAGVILEHTAAHQTYRISRMLEAQLDKPAAELTARAAARIYDQHAASGGRGGQAPAVATHRLDLRLVGTCWRWGVKRGLVKGNVWAEVEPIGRARKGKATLRASEAGRFIVQATEWAAGGSPTSLAALVCLLTGARSSEALGVTVRDVDGGHLYIAGTKTARSKRRVKMPELLRVLLERVCTGKAATDRLMPATKQQLHGAVLAICEAAGVPRVCPHGLRATFACLSVEGGVSVESIAAALGHTSTEMTLQHYVSADSAASGRVAAFERAVIVPKGLDLPN